MMVESFFNAQRPVKSEFPTALSSDSKGHLPAPKSPEEALSCLSGPLHYKQSSLAEILGLLHDWVVEE